MNEDRHTEPSMYVWQAGNSKRRRKLFLSKSNGIVLAMACVHVVLCATY
jgi:hypothetical protein